MADVDCTDGTKPSGAHQQKSWQDTDGPHCPSPLAEDTGALQAICAGHSQPPFLGALHPACWQPFLKISTPHPSAKAYENEKVMGKDCKMLLGAVPWVRGTVPEEERVEQGAGRLWPPP